ncbi:MULTISPECIES: hypothetical protein [Rhodococcus]|uniref:Uncharacterized protein n=1 Tax=Rhodococcus qingshengii TaxID=334542 RepID=A0A2A5IXD3_RHOSG|nr:hypothetical protein [Rhodococcus qingshengii]PCK21649.1 hypothetical protein CHR55_33695 [Rhodococcus qingshengii]
MFGFAGARPKGHAAGEAGKIGRNWGVLRKRRDVHPEDWIIVPRPLLPEDVSDLGQALPAMQRPTAAMLIYPPALEKADTVAGRRGRRRKTVITTESGGGVQVWSSWLQSLQHELWHACEAEHSELHALLLALDAEIVTADGALAKYPAMIAAARQGADTAGKIEVDSTPRSDAEAADAEHIRLDRRRRDRDYEVAQARAAVDTAEKERIELVGRIRELLDRRRYVWQVLLCRVGFLVEHYNRRANVYLTATRMRVRSEVPLLDRPVWAHIEAIAPAPVLVNMELIEQTDAA